MTKHTYRDNDIILLDFGQSRGQCLTSCLARGYETILGFTDKAFYGNTSHDWCYCMRSKEYSYTDRRASTMAPGHCTDYRESFRQAGLRADRS